MASQDRDLRIVDLFSGSGGLSLGAMYAAIATQSRPVMQVAVDTDADALAVYAQNHPGVRVLSENVDNLVDQKVDDIGRDATMSYPPEIVDATLAPFLGQTDLLLAGPPCQGHSNLNNHTRRYDERNKLYITTAAIAIALQARMVVIENVPAVLRDHFQVVDTAHAVLAEAGYTVSHGILAADALGGAQTRKRHILVATRGYHVPVKVVAATMKRPPMTLREMIGDLEGIPPSDDVFDTAPTLSAENAMRVAWLHENDAYNLPNEIRPKCHRDGHTYPSVYGRMYYDQPAPTITTGFMTPGRGRFVHPTQRRVLTPHEAARVQGFPDWYDFKLDGKYPSRKLLGKWIGDAVPSQLGYVAVLAALSSLFVNQQP